MSSPGYRPSGALILWCTLGFVITFLGWSVLTGDFKPSTVLPQTNISGKADVDPVGWPGFENIEDVIVLYDSPAWQQTIS